MGKNKKSSIYFSNILKQSIESSSIENEYIKKKTCIKNNLSIKSFLEDFKLDCESDFSSLNKAFILSKSKLSKIDSFNFQIQKSMKKKKNLDKKNYFFYEIDKKSDTTENFSEKIKIDKNNLEKIILKEKKIVFRKKSRSCKIRSFVIKSKNYEIFDKSDSEISIFCFDYKKKFLRKQFFKFQKKLKSEYLDFENKEKNFDIKNIQKKSKKIKPIFDIVEEIRRKKNNRYKKHSSKKLRNHSKKKKNIVSINKREKNRKFYSL